MTMTGLHAEQALTGDGWRSAVRLDIADGMIASVATNAPPLPGDQRCRILLPAMPNLHSHAFQRGMAGLAERRGPGADDFWSWRDTMYRFALAITPDETAAIAAQLYVEMLEAGFARVAEFHYLHHDHDGRPYDDPAAMAAAIAVAARESGIGLTLLPVFYAHSGFGGMPPDTAQRRFVTTLDQFDRLLEGCRRAIAPNPASVLGVAAHSLRAVTPEQLSKVAGLRTGAPFHIHVAEQAKEVADCLNWSGRRPVEWLLEAQDIDARWCLVHATHMTPAETENLSRTGAVAGLCPITEANLGDGVFPCAPFADAGGHFGVGSDSNVLIGVADELRQLEYSQRLFHRTRTIMAAPNGSTGSALFHRALAGGARATGQPPPVIRVGAPADLVSLDADHPALVGCAPAAILDAWIFGASRPAIDSVWVGGVLQVKAGCHRRREQVYRRFAAAVRALADRL